MATADDPEWERCEEHEVRYDSHECPYCQRERDDDAGPVVEHESIPPALLDRDRWMLYDTEAEERRPFGWDARRGRLDKSASWKNDDDLLSFDDAREAAASKESYGTIYILNQDSPFAVIDIDRGIDDAGRPKEWLPKLAPFLGETYTDLSPSGGGIHVWYRGDLPEWWEDKHVTAEEHEGVDAFDGDTPMTVTGEAPPAPWSDRTATINRLDDAAAEEWLKSAWGNLADESDESTPWNPEPDTRTPGESRSKPVPTAAGDGPGGDWLGEAEAREALGCIDPDTHHDEWIKVGFALTDHFGDHRGKELFREWSQGGSKWDDKAAREVEGLDDREPPAGKKVGIGTLIEKAKAGGWDASGAAREALDDAAAEGNDHAGGVVDSGRSGTGGSGTAPSWGAVKKAYTGDESKRTARGKAIEKLLSDHTYVSPRDTEAIWVYRPGEGVYDREGEAHIREKLTQNLGVSATGYEINEILKQVRGRRPIDREAFDAYTPPLVCVKNGVLNVVTRELHDHDPKYLFRKRLEAKYDPEADTGPAWSFLNTLVAREADAKTLAELPALCLWQSHDILPAFGVLIGDGANGKGMYEKLLTRFFGSDNVENIGLQTLENNRFAVAQLENAFANLGSDIPGAKVNDLPTIKSITGGDHIQVERKYEDSYSTKIPATPIFSVNDPPTFGEKGHALARRIVPVEFPYKFTDDPGEGEKQAEKESKLMEELTTEEALSGFLNLILDAGDRVRENEDVSLPEGPGERLERYEKKADPIAAFRDECLESVDEGYVTKEAVYKAYVRFCEEKDIEAKGKITFYRELRRATDLTIEDPQVRLGEFGKEDRVTTLRGVFLTPKGRELCPKLDTTRAVNKKRNTDPWPDSIGAGLDTENPENRDPRLRVLDDEIQEVAAALDGVGFDELAGFVSLSTEYPEDDVKERIKAMENERKLTKSADGYEAPERADLTDLMD